MKRMKYALAMLGAGGAMGAASDAAAVTTVTLDIAFTDPVQDVVLIDGEAAQFVYGASSFKIFGKTLLAPLTDAYTGIIVEDPGLPAAGEVFNQISVMTVKAFKGPPEILVADRYIHLAFRTAGTNYVGSAYIDENAALAEITFDEGDFIVGPSPAPEPDAWALLIGGFGAAGAALRARRRSQALSA